MSAAALAVPGAALGARVPDARPAGASAAAAGFDEHRIGDLGRDRDRSRRLVIVGPFEPLELGRGDDLRDVEERVAFEAYVNKGGLHAGQHLRDPALVDVADDAALILALDEDLDDLVVLEDGDTRVVPARGDDHLLVHGRSSAKAVDDAGARRGRAGAGVAAVSPASQQANSREQQQRHRDVSS